MRIRLLMVVAVIAVLGGCSTNGDLALNDGTTEPTTAVADPAQPDDIPTPVSETEQSTVPPETVAPEVEAQSAPPRLGDPAADRVVIATRNGEVYLVDADGGNRLDLAAGGDAGQGLQPVWSPNGRRIAWSQRNRTGFSIVSTNADGTERRQANTLFSGYFGYWNPTSTQLGFLGNAPPGTGLVLDSGTGASLDAVVDSDTFYYFSWNPDGTRWVVHSGSGLSIVTQDGDRQPLALDDARFRAPVWAPDGTVLVSIRRAGRNVIVRLDPTTGDVDELLEVGEVANFVLDPTGRFLAVESIEVATTESEPGEGTTISAQQPREQAELLVYDIVTGETQLALESRSGGFWWSPDGTTLAILVFEEAAPAEFTQWLVWRPEGSFRTEPFLITPTFATSYVPFFDQFAQSVTPWSPDSTRFVYAGFDTEREPGVFVQLAQPDTPAERIAEAGEVAFWSPT